MGKARPCEDLFNVAKLVPRSRIDLARSNATYAMPSISQVMWLRIRKPHQTKRNGMEP